MIRPEIFVTVDGTPVAGAFFTTLISLAISDREGLASDSMELVFADAPPHFQSPRRGAVVRIEIVTDGGGSFAGSYVVDRVQFACFPHTITVGGHSADLQSEMKTARTRHWDDVTVRDVVEEIAGDYGLEPRIADAVSGHHYDWLGQQEETDPHFLERLARRHGALFTIKDGRLLWVERGRGRTASGDSLAPLVIGRSSIIEGSCKVTISDAATVKAVKAYWQDRAGAERREIVVECDPEATGEHVIRTAFETEAAARDGAEAVATELRRGAMETSCAIEGRPALTAGQPVAYRGVRPLVDGVEFILETVQHRYGKTTGLRTTFSGKQRIE